MPIESWFVWGMGESQKWALWLLVLYLLKKKNCGKVYITYRGFPGSSIGKESACSAGETGFIPGLGRSAGEGNGKPLQYPCLKNPMDRGAWWAVDHGIAKSQAQLSN